MINYLMIAYNKKYNQLKKELADFLYTYEAEYQSLTEVAVEDIFGFYNDIEQLTSILKPSFIQEEQALVKTEEYQKAYEEFERIAAISWNNQFSEKNRQDFIRFSEALFIRNSLSPTENNKNYLSVDFKSLLKPAVEQPQQKRTVDSSSLLDKIKKKQKRMLQFCLFFIFALYIWKPDVLEDLFILLEGDEPKPVKLERSAITEYVGEEMQSTDVMTEIVEPDPDPFYYESYEVEAFLNEFRDHYFSALNEKDFHYITSYLEPNSPAYQGLRTYIENELPEIYQFSNQETTVTSISEVSNNSFDVETTETFTYENELGDLIHYLRTKTYSISDLEGYFSIYKIDIAHTEHTTEELETTLLVSEEDIKSFLWKYTDDKLYEASYGDINNLKKYYDLTGSAWLEVNAYVERLSSQEVKLSLNLFNVTSILKEDPKHYLVDVRTNHEEFSTYGPRTMIDKKEQYRLAVDQNGAITIVDKTREDITYQEEIPPGIAGDPFIYYEESNMETVEQQGGIE